MAVEIVLGIVLLSMFPIKLLIGELIFARYLKRREGFGWRLGLSAVLQIALSVLLFLPVQGTHWILENTLYYFAQFALSAFLLRLLFAENMSDLIPCAVAGYMTEHTASQVFEILFGRMRTGLETADAGRFMAYGALEVLVFVAVSALIWWVFAKNATAISGSQTLKKNLLWLSIATLCVVLLLSSVRDRYAAESEVLMVITRLLSIFCCVTLLYIRYGILEKAQLEAEHTELMRVMAEERKQFALRRENIELINIKCHDMRHRIEAWERQGIAVDPDEMQEMKELIGIYDASIHTGNDTLDVILSEHSLYCEKHGIRLSCIANGEKLGFMSTGDICSLFGNAIENAIEAVSRLEKPEDRIISFQVREQKGLLLVTVENYYTGTITIENGLPKTGKQDGLNHGFGLRSIRRTAEKYGGEMTVRADELFHLTVLIPIPAK